MLLKNEAKVWSLVLLYIFEKGKGLSPVHRNTESVEILTRVQFLYTCNDLNGSSAPVHWTQAAPFEKYVKGNIKDDVCVKSAAVEIRSNSIQLNGLVEV